MQHKKAIHSSLLLPQGLSVKLPEQATFLLCLWQKSPLCILVKLLQMSPLPTEFILQLLHSRKPNQFHAEEKEILNNHQKIDQSMISIFLSKVPPGIVLILKVDESWQAYSIFRHTLLKIQRFWKQRKEQFLPLKKIMKILL